MAENRSKEKRDADRRRVAALYLQGRYQVDIAAELGIDQSTVSRDLKAIRKEWRASSVRDFDEARAQELAKIDELEREAWAAWERSKAETRTVTRRRRQVPAGDGTAGELSEQSLKTEQRHGDISYWNAVLKCVERRCALLGLDEPQKLDVKSRGVIKFGGVDIEF